MRTTARPACSVPAAGAGVCDTEIMGRVGKDPQAGRVAPVTASCATTSESSGGWEGSTGGLRYTGDTP
jgi:hypothetical protein